VFVSAVGRPLATHCHFPAAVFTYRSRPLTPVAGMCGIARFLFVTVQRA
jgi:hypothetical protein